MVVRIRRNCVIIFVLMLGLLNLPLLSYLNNVVSIANDIVRIVAALCAGIFMVLRKKGKLSWILIMIVLMQISLFYSTLINNGDLWSCFTLSCSYIAIAFVFEGFSDNLGDLIDAFMFLAELICYANLITVLLFPEGMYSSYRSASLWYSTKNWLFGNRNLFIVYLLPSCVIAFVYRMRGGNRWRELGIYLASIISVSVATVRSATSMVGIVALLVLFFLIKRGFSIKTYYLLAVNIILFFVIVVFRLQNLFGWLIEDILGKSLTFTGRTGLWDAVLLILRKKLLFGYGVQTMEYYKALVGYTYAGHAHNLVLNYLYKGGVVQLFLYIALMVIVYRNLHRVQSHQIAQGISVALFVFQVMALMEPYEYAFIFVLYYLAYYASKLENGEKGKLPHKIFQFGLGNPRRFIEKEFEPQRKEVRI